MVKSANYIALIVEDVDKTADFYKEKLGMKTNDELTVSGQFAIFQTEGGAMFALQKAIETKDGATVDQSIAVALAVDDADSFYAELKEKGVELLDEPNDMPYGRTFLMRAPGGQVLRIYKPYSAA